MTPRDERALARDKRVLAREQRDPGPYVHPNFDFLELPAELRNMVYDQVWQYYNRVAAFHLATRTGILAYYDGTILDESESTTDYSLLLNADGAKWRPKNAAACPNGF
jgi:hypothetical protein